MSDEPPTDQEATPRPSPKRGAFPTPASEIEQATPYVPPAEVDDPDAAAEEDPGPDGPAD